MTVRMTQYIYIRVYVGLFTNGRIYRPYVHDANCARELGSNGEPKFVYGNNIYGKPI